MQIDWKGLGTMSNKCSGTVVADVLVGEGGLGEKSTLFNPKINQWVRMESAGKSTREGMNDSFSAENVQRQATAKIPAINY